MQIKEKIDMRFQPSADPIDLRWMGATPGHERFTAEGRHNEKIFPRSMEQAKKDWGLIRE